MYFIRHSGNLTYLLFSYSHLNIFLSHTLLSVPTHVVLISKFMLHVSIDNLKKNMHGMYQHLRYMTLNQDLYKSKAYD